MANYQVALEVEGVADFLLAPGDGNGPCARARRSNERRLAMDGVSETQAAGRGNGTALTTLGGVTNDAASTIAIEQPYAVTATMQGAAPFIFHAWSVDAVAEKAKARKGSRAKKEDDVESYVYRLPSGELAIPGAHFRGAIVNAARFKQDPRSPRKSAMDLFKAGVVPLTELCGLGTHEWDYLDRRRVVVQRNAITRVRPAMAAGWKVTVDLQVLLPEYIDATLLLEVATMAGRLCGVGDARPTFGRFQIVRWECQAIG